MHKPTYQCTTMTVEKGQPRAVPAGYLVEDGWRLRSGSLYLILRAEKPLESGTATGEVSGNA